MRVPVVAHPAEDREPDVRLERVALRERPVGLARQPRADDGLERERQREAAADPEVRPRREALVEPEADDEGEGADPDRGVAQEPELGGPLRRVRPRREPDAAPRARRRALQGGEAGDLGAQDEGHGAQDRLDHGSCAAPAPSSVLRVVWSNECGAALGSAACSASTS